ncbi:hypothetical protein KUCAC02_028062 [Chaenocephalus aceratus]|uniref:Uncharacterized protein n=1 Tax=Chaenocephalus aceratus TaxID=36190 RepID=A0ACB9X2H6_CHAAC|nr:hypothetical protein KUCAC02_028062 [Chaenocephalus aceratus]
MRSLHSGMDPHRVRWTSKAKDTYPHIPSPMGSMSMLLVPCQEWRWCVGGPKPPPPSQVRPFDAPGPSVRSRAQHVQHDPSGPRTLCLQSGAAAAARAQILAYKILGRGQPLPENSN